MSDLKAARGALRAARAAAGACLILTLEAAPAAAVQRDPFDPVIDTSAEVTTDTGETTSSTQSATTAETTTTTETPQPAPDDETLPATGGRVSSWLAIAYVMIAAGAAMLGFARFPDESPRRARRRPGRR